MKGKKLLSVILSVLMVQGVVATSAISSLAVELEPATSQAEVKSEAPTELQPEAFEKVNADIQKETSSAEYSYNGYEYSVIDAEATITGYTGTETKLTIPSVIDGYAVTAIGESAFDGNCNITFVAIPDSVKAIGLKAFYRCEEITSLELGNGVTSIANSAFAFCLKLKSVAIPNSVTYIGDCCFYDCNRMVSATIGNSVNRMGDYVFYDCDVLTNVTIAKGTTDLGRYIFEYCEKLTSVSIPDTITVIEEGVFHCCEALTTVVIPDSVTKIGNKAFATCTALQHITIPDSVTQIGNKAFATCTALQHITIPDSVTEIGDGLFVNCDALMDMPIPASSTKINEEMFANCFALTDVTIPERIKTIEDKGFYGCKNITNVSFGDGVTTIGSGAFAYCDSLTDITIPNNVNSIGDGSFENCRGLKTVTIAKGSGITRINTETFRNCYNLETVTLASGVKEIAENAFKKCRSLKEIYIPDTVTKIGAVSENSSSLREYEIFENHSADLTICGAKDSFAERFAKANSINFKAVDIPVLKIKGDIDLTLAETEKNILTGTVDLQPGKYAFNIEDNGKLLGYNYTYTDKATIDYSAGYKAPTTLKATGGRYTFTYNASTKVLKIQHKSFNDIVELFGDINVELVRTSSDSTVFTGSARVEAGTYNFKINDQGTEMGFKHSFDDAVNGVQYGAGWSASTFNATGGIYSVKYDTATNKLTFKHTPKGLGDVRVFGDINLPLASQGNNVYSATKALEAGTYQFRIDALGKTVCNGSEFTNGMNGVAYNVEWKAATTFNVTEKQKFTFIFDANTNKIKVFNAPIDTTKVLVAFEDSNLELVSTDGVNYKATTELKAGTYAFRIDEFGVTLGYGGTYSDNINGIKYNEGYVSATTLKATGGNYTFTYNVETDELTVAKA
ncbi:MAG: leucine-rich repeat protein [Acutalibacteraceae bacterium]|nr:leucine-rich repeat protein [Acutalibacteraceae bacterium]